MTVRQTMGVGAAATLLAIGLPAASPDLDAKPLPTAFAGRATGGIASLDISAHGIDLGLLDVATSAASVDSTADARTTARSRNGDARVTTLADEAPVVEQTAPPHHRRATTGALSDLDGAGIVEAGAARGAAQARWARTDDYCLPSGTELAWSRTSMASLSVGRREGGIARVGPARTRATTELISNGGARDARSVVSTVTGSLANVSLFDGAVSMVVDGAPRVTATASGVHGGATGRYSAPTVRLTAPRMPGVVLQPGDVVDVRAGGARAAITMGTAVVDEAGDGREASVDVTVLSIDIDLAGDRGTARVDVLPLHAEATAPAGGVECALASPVITSPDDGERTAGRPTIAGTGEPDARLTVHDRSGTIGTVGVDRRGTWSLTPDRELADGAHTIEASQVLGGSSSAHSPPVRFEVDSTSPRAPRIDTPANGERTNDDTPALGGTGEPGATVTIHVGRRALAPTTVGPNGGWTRTPGRPLPDGAQRITVIQADDVGNESPATTATVVVDTRAPAVPTIDSPIHAAPTNDRTPAIAGGGEAGAVVSVTIDDGRAMPATVGRGGRWALPRDRRLGDGRHTVTAAQTDDAGNTSERAAATFRVDTSRPAAPRIESPAPRALTDDDTPTVAGRGEPRATVEIEIDGARVASASVGRRGRWGIGRTTPLADGKHVITVIQADRAGNSSPTRSRAVRIDATAPATPAITSPVDHDVTAGDIAAVRGRGEPGSTVTVRTGGAAAHRMATTVGHHGNWIVRLPQALANGRHRISAVQRDSAGNRSPVAAVAITIDTIAPTQPSITNPPAASNDGTPTVAGAGERGASVTIVVDGVSRGSTHVGPHGNWSLALTATLADGNHTVVATQHDLAGNASPATTSTFAVDTVAPGRPTIAAPGRRSAANNPSPMIRGTGEPGATVGVVIDGIPADEMVAAADGRWALRLTDPLADGEHILQTAQTDAVGNVSAHAVRRFTIDTTAPLAPVLTAPRASSLINDRAPRLTGSGEPGATVHVRIDRAALGTTTVGPRGNWTFDGARPLTDGARTVTVTATDTAGNASTRSTSTFTIDATAPRCPAINTSAVGALTADDTPTIAGRGEPGATVRATTVTGSALPGRLLGTATVGGKGRWGITPDPLDDGRYTLTVVQVDAAGNPARSCKRTGFAVDATAPAAPVITSPLTGDIISDRTPTLTGTGERRAPVDVYVDGRLIGSPRADTNGAWHLQVEVRLPIDEHTITATQADAVGNRSPATTATFSIGAPEPIPTDSSGIPGITPLAMALLGLGAVAVLIGGALSRRT